jgi:hypothetical protein
MAGSHPTSKLLKIKGFLGVRFSCFSRNFGLKVGI